MKVIRPYKIWNKFFECECHTEGIVVSAAYYRELEDDNYLSPEINLAYWQEGLYYNKKLTWKQRIRLIWQILTTGKTWHDMVCLDRTTAKELGEHLIQFSKKRRKRKKVKATPKPTTGKPTTKGG